MIRNKGIQKFEMERMRNERLDVKRSFQIEESLYQEAVALGIFPLGNPFEGLEVDIRIAKAINRVSKTA